MPEKMIFTSPLSLTGIRKMHLDLTGPLSYNSETLTGTTPIVTSSNTALVTISLAAAVLTNLQRYFTPEVNRNSEPFLSQLLWVTYNGFYCLHLTIKQSNSIISIESKSLDTGYIPVTSYPAFLKYRNESI